MDFNTVMMIVGGLVFTAGMFTLIGHSMATDECQRNIGDSRDAFDKERSMLQQLCRNALNQRDRAIDERAQKIKEHNDKVGFIIEALRINDAFKEEHLNDPMLALADLIKSEHQAVLDVNSPEIKRIVSKAKREHGKKVRGQFERKLKREIDKVLSDTQRVRVECGMWKVSSQKNAENMTNARLELSMYQGIVSQELDNFIRLPSVRNACIKAINAQHKAWQEL